MTSLCSGNARGRSPARSASSVTVSRISHGAERPVPPSWVELKQTLLLAPSNSRGFRSRSMFPRGRRPGPR